MDACSRYSSKAEIYARYRWDYAYEAIQAIFNATSISTDSVVADIGSGTGILTRHFVGRVKNVYAIEPNPEMRQWAEKNLSSYPSFCSLGTRAEATGLADKCVSLITIGQALHWFDPEPGLREFKRILKPGGWLAVLSNQAVANELDQALQTLFIKENDWDISLAANLPAPKPVSFFYGEGYYSQMWFPQRREETWEEFFGSLCSNSHAPDNGNPSFQTFELAARRVFDQFSRHSLVTVDFVTELTLGSIN